MKKGWRKQPKKAKNITIIKDMKNIFANLKDWRPTLAAVVVAGSVTISDWIRVGFPENWAWALILIVFGALSGSKPAPKATPVT